MGRGQPRVPRRQDKCPRGLSTGARGRSPLFRDSPARAPGAIFVARSLPSLSRAFMSRLVILSLALLAGCATPPAVGTPRPGELPRTHAPAPTESAITAGDLMTRLYIIADDSMLGRESGTLGNVKVTNYVAQEMQRMGLRPAGENGTFFQTVPVTISRIDSTRRLMVDGAELALGTDYLPYYAPLANRLLPVGASTRSLDGVPVVYGGRLGETLIDPAAAAGKLVVFGVPGGGH